MNTLLGKGSLAQVWIYLVGPFAGAAVAALLFRVQNPDSLTRAFRRHPLTNDCNTILNIKRAPCGIRTERVLFSVFLFRA